MKLLHGDCREMLKGLADASVDSIVTDPPYELGFMGKSWDSSGVAYDVTVWQECFRVLKPGGHLLSFGGSRTYHRMACAIEDAGFEIRDQIMWVYGSGFPKSLNISKAIDKAAGSLKVVGQGRAGKTALGQSSGYNKTNNPHEFDITEPNSAEAKEWDGWGTALKPAHEPIVMARKPLDGTVANNVLTHGVGGINIDGTRVAYPEGEVDFNKVQRQQADGSGNIINNAFGASALVGTEIKTYKENGRFPANFIYDGSEEVTELIGDAARFFYCAKASKAERNAGLEGFAVGQAKGGGGGIGDYLDDVNSASGKYGSEKAPQRNYHPTVKPIALMRYLVRLVTPPNGTVLDPFAGSGSTLVAATMEKFDCIGIELTNEYLPIIEARVANAQTDTLF